MISIFQPEATGMYFEDSMYFVHRIGEDFSVEFADEELAKVLTVGEFYELLLSELETGDSCRSSQAFYRLRKAMMSCFDMPKKAIRPATKLAVLLPEGKRRMLWKRMEIETLLVFPKLRHPRWGRDVIRSITVVAAIAAHYFASRWLQPHGALWVSFEFGVLTVFVVVRQILYAATARLGVVLPVKTAGELAQVLLKTNFTQFGLDEANSLPYSRTETWNQVVYLLGEEAGVDPGSITAETRFREDLKIA